jgi:hypothetical protein
MHRPLLKPRREDAFQSWKTTQIERVRRNHRVMESMAMEYKAQMQEDLHSIHIEFDTHYSRPSLSLNLQSHLNREMLRMLWTTAFNNSERIIDGFLCGRHDSYTAYTPSVPWNSSRAEEAAVLCSASFVYRICWAGPDRQARLCDETRRDCEVEGRGRREEIQRYKNALGEFGPLSEVRDPTRPAT